MRDSYQSIQRPIILSAKQISDLYGTERNQNYENSSLDEQSLQYEIESFDENESFVLGYN